MQAPIQVVVLASIKFSGMGRYARLKDAVLSGWILGLLRMFCINLRERGALMVFNNWFARLNILNSIAATSYIK
jgi:hypothetical protein